VAEVSDTQTTTGQFIVSFPTPVAVVAGETWTFTMAVSGTVNIPRDNAAPGATNTADVTWLECREQTTFDTYPNVVAAVNRYYVEPIFQAAL
jgi:hypothetical protein